MREVWRTGGKVVGCLPTPMRRNLVFVKRPIIISDPDILGGTPVFHGTRVPAQTLFGYLEAGDTIDDFLEGFPSVTREHVIAFLEEAKNRLIESAT